MIRIGSIECIERSVKARQTCNAIITVISTLKHQHLTPDESSAIRLHMADLLTAADALKIPWKLQNSLLYIGELYDAREWYLDRLFAMACNRIGIDGGIK